MKFLITNFLLFFAGLVAQADTVSFGWSHNTEPDLAEYRLYWGPASGGYDRVLIIPAGQNRVTVPDMDPDSFAVLTAINQVRAESLPSAEARYHPVIVEAVLEFADEITGPKFTPSGEVARLEIFRVADVLFDPASVQIPSRLNIQRNQIEIVTDARTFTIATDTTAGRRFFRAYVAARL